MKKFFLKNKKNVKIFDLGNHPFADSLSKIHLKG